MLDISHFTKNDGPLPFSLDGWNALSMMANEGQMASVSWMFSLPNPVVESANIHPNSVYWIVLGMIVLVSSLNFLGVFFGRMRHSAGIGIYGLICAVLAGVLMVQMALTNGVLPIGASGNLPVQTWILSLLPDGIARLNPDFSMVILSTIGLQQILFSLIVAWRYVKQRRLKTVKIRRSGGLSSNLLNGISHELRTPMNAILGFSELLKQSPLTVEQADYANTVYDAGQDLLGLINLIIDYSKYDADQLDFQAGAFDPRESCWSIISSYADKAHARGLEIGLFVDPNVPHLVHGAHQRVHQCLVLLIENALLRCSEAMRSDATNFGPSEAGAVPSNPLRSGGGISVNVRASKKSRKGEAYLEIEIHDTGLKLPENCLQVSMGQADELTRYDERSRGPEEIRFALIKGIVHRMGGKIELIETSLFENSLLLDLPVQIETEQCEKATKSPSAGDLVLVVAKNPVVQSSMQLQLGALMMQVDTAGSALNAFEKMRQADESGRPYDLLVVDDELPGTDGRGLIRSIHKDSKLNPTPILYLSFSNRSDLGPEDIADVYLPKPVNPDRLCRELVRLQSEVSEVKCQSGPDTDAPDGSPNRILILTSEDRKDINFVGRLHKAGYAVHVTIASVGLLSKIEQRKYDLLIIDLVDLWHEGLVLSQRIRSSNAEYRHMPILGLARVIEPKNISSMCSSGLNDVILEPVDADEMILKIDRWMKTEAAEEQSLSMDALWDAYFGPPDQQVDLDEVAQIA